MTGLGLAGLSLAGGFDRAALAALGQVLVIDLMLAGDNAVVVGLAISGLPASQKRPAMLLGIGAAALIRISLALVALRLLALVGLLFAGGVLLLWVSWRMARELRHAPAQDGRAPAKTLRQAATQIVLADLSMSLDNVLAVAGAAHGHRVVLVVGLIGSVILMAVAADLLARLLARYRFIAWGGLLVVVYVALELMVEGAIQIRHAFGPG